MSYNTDLCRICLASDIRLHTISNTPLQTVFERITDLPLHTTEWRPVAACYFCYAQLKRCHNLMRTAYKAENLLTRMLQHKSKEPNKLVSVMDHNGNSLSRPLSITPIDCIDTFSFNAPIAVKEESEHMLDIIKQEIDFEESIDSPHDPDLSSDLFNDKCELDLKDADVLRNIRLEQECYSYKVKIEPVGEEGNSWQDATLKTSESTEQIQFNTNNLLVKKKKHAKKHKRKHGEKHLKNSSVSIKPEKQDYAEYNSSYEKPESQNPKTNTVGKHFECNHCQYQFHRKSHLETHMVLHKGEKPFQCSYCQKRFHYKHGLERHLKTHTGEKSFQCPVCLKMFVEKSVMKIHLRTHTGEQPYECDICEKRFKQRNDMKRHRRTHTGEKPFKCDICQRRFNERSKVARHQKKHYGEKLTKRDLKKLFL